MDILAKVIEDVVGKRTVGGVSTPFSDVCWTATTVFKIRGLKRVRVGSGISHEDRQNLTGLECERLQTFGNSAPPSSTLTCKIDERAYIVLCTSRLDPTPRVSTLEGACAFVQHAAALLQRYRRSSPHGMTVAGYPHILDQVLETPWPTFLNQLKALSPRRATVGTVLHGDFRQNNLMLSGSNLNIIDPSTLPCLYQTTLTSEMASLWASFDPTVMLSGSRSLDRAYKATEQDESFCHFLTLYGIRTAGEALFSETRSVHAERKQLFDGVLRELEVSRNHE